ncbi:MAG: hypothetical protein ABIP94_03910 [Planctomycetota bacterium]
MLLAPVGPLAAQGAAPSSCNTTNIHWVLPGDFSTALQRAVAEQRLLLIKGISFGVDEAGATCATKGKW